MTIECKSETNKGELIGGWPGTDTAEIEFDECVVAAHTACHATTVGKGSGIIGPFKVKTLLGFPKGKAPNKEEAYDQFFPTPSETVFVTFELTGECGKALEKDKIEVVATGTKAAVTGTPKCGVIAILGKIVEPGEVFTKTVSGEVAEKGGLQFPTPAITEEEVWNPTTEKYEVVKCGLEARTTNGNVAAKEVGVAQVETEPSEPFGWEE